MAIAERRAGAGCLVAGVVLCCLVVFTSAASCTVPKELSRVPDADFHAARRDPVQRAACLLRWLKDRSRSKGLSWLAYAYLMTDGDDSTQWETKLSKAWSSSVVKPIRFMDVLGPFPIGKAELDGHPVHPLRFNASVSGYQRTVDGLWSEYLPRGKVARVETVAVAEREDPWLQYTIREVPFLAAQMQLLHTRAVLEFQAYATMELYFPGPSSISCSGAPVTTLWLDTVPFAGDVYSEGRFSWSVPSRFIHRWVTLRVPLRGVVDLRWQCYVKSEPEDENAVAIGAPDVVPHLVVDSSTDGRPALPFNSHLRVSVPVLNRSPDRVASVWSSAVQRNFLIFPGQMAAVPIDERVTVPSACRREGDGDRRVADVDIPIRYHFGRSDDDSGYATERLRVPLECRNVDDVFLHTFVDADGTVRAAGVVAPEAARPYLTTASCETAESLAPMPVVLSFHGTGVTAQSQASSYKVGKPNSSRYKFGVPGYWLVAPDRHGAHNWEGPALETGRRALEGLAGDCRGLVDVDRVVVAGHSMGGHGAWVWSERYINRVVGVSAAAGWLRKEAYSDANQFMLMDQQVSVPAALRAVLWASVAGHFADAHADVLADVPVMIRVGQQDRTVSPYYSRRMAGILRSREYTEMSMRNVGDAKPVRSNVTYDEVAGMEHWWWSTKTDNDGGVMLDKPMRKFFRSVLRTSGRQSNAEIAASRLRSGSAVVVTSRAKEGYAGCAVLPSCWTCEHEVRLQLDEREQAVTVTTENVARIRLQWSFWKHFQGDVARLALDDTALTFDAWTPHTDLVCAQHAEYEWECQQASSDESHASSHLTLPPGTLGAFDGEQLVVAFDPTCLTCRDVGVYLANLYYVAGYTSVGFADLRDDVPQRDGVTQIRVGIGLSVGPLRFRTDDGVASLTFPLERRRPQPSSALHMCDVQGSFAVLAYHRSTHALVVTGTDEEALLFAGRLGQPTVPPMVREPFTNLYPDVSVFDMRWAWQRGWKAAHTAGYWNPSGTALNSLDSFSKCL